MARGGRDKDREGPERRCIATGARAPRAGLIRFVVGPDGVLVPDLAGKLPGRGIWVASEAAALSRALGKGLFARAARQSVTVPPDLPRLIEAGLARRIADTLGLARKAGQAVAGYEKVKSWLESGQAAVLVQAADGSERGKARLRPPPGEGAFIGCLTASELGLAFGRENVIHGALSAGGLADRVVEDAARLSGLRGNDGEQTPGRTRRPDERQ